LAERQSGLHNSLIMNDPASYRRVYPFLWALLALVIAIFCFAPLNNYRRGGSTKDYAVWYPTGQRVLHQQDIYVKQEDGTFEYMYPPTAATLLAFPAATGKLGMMITLVTLNSAAFVVSIFLSVYFVTGRLWNQHPLLYVLPAACALPFIWATYLLGQVNLLLLALMLLGFFCLQTKRSIWAGSLFALATSIKAFPLMIIVYLLYRRMWTAAVAMLVALFLLVLVLPLAFNRDSVADLRTWSQGMLLSNKDEGIGQRPQRTFLWKNQSLLAVVNRLMRPVPADHLEKKTPATTLADGTTQPEEMIRTPVFVNIMNVSARTANIVVVIIAALLGLFFILCIPRKSARTATSDAYEFSMLLLMILMFSPYSFGYFYTWLILPLAVAWNAVGTSLQRPRPSFLTLAWLVAALLILLLGLPFGPFLVARNIGNNFFACLILLLGLGLLLRQSHRQATAALATQLAV
jgi:hypothetical protein